MSKQKEEILEPPIPQKITEKIDYKDITKKSIIEKIKETFPKKLIPTKYFGKILILIFILVFVVAGFNFPFASLMAGNTDITINVGYPLPFFKLELTNNEGSAFLVLNFLLDSVIYLILTYIMNIFLNLILQSKLFNLKDKSKKSPTVFKNQISQ